MSAPLIVVPGATTAITRRTTLRKAFLAPWHPLVEDNWLYSLADAQRETGVEVHSSVLNITHHHTDVTPTRDNLPEFTRRFHRDMSCSLHTLLCQERYDVPRELWDDRQTHYMRLVDAEAQASRLIYDALNPCAAGLVQRPEHMPMRTLDFGLWKTGFIEVKRPPVYFGKDRPERLKLYLTPPPVLYRAFGGDIDALVYQMNKLMEDGIRAIRDARTRPVMGAKVIRRIHPWSEPRTMRESGAGRVPTFRIGARNMLGYAQRRDGAREVTSFRRGHHETRTARRDGDLEQSYPHGTYAARVYHGAPVDDVSHDALVAQPGPLLEDVKAELAREQRDRDAVRERTRDIVDEVREAWRDEAAEVVADAELNRVEVVHVAAARRRGPKESGGGDGAAGGDVGDVGEDEAADRGPAVVRHRFDRRRRETARRMVILRDRRRGRPRRGDASHGSDPPH